MWRFADAGDLWARWSGGLVDAGDLVGCGCNQGPGDMERKDSVFCSHIGLTAKFLWGDMPIPAAKLGKKTNPPEGPDGRLGPGVNDGSTRVRHCSNHCQNKSHRGRVQYRQREHRH